MDASKSRYNGCVICLIQDISNALNLTLNGIVFLIKLFLIKGFSEVLLGNFQIDRLEGKLKTYHQCVNKFSRTNNEQFNPATTEIF